MDLHITSKKLSPRKGSKTKKKKFTTERIEKNIPISNLSNVCQCCLAQENLFSMNEQYSEDTIDQTYSEVLSKCFALESLQVGETTPMICAGCSVQLKAAFQFRQRVEQTRIVLTSSRTCDFINHDDCKSFPEEKCDDESLSVAVCDSQNDNEINKKPSPGERSHLPYILDKNKLTCEVCSRVFAFYSDLVQHMPIHYPNQICDVCGKICASKRSLFFHQKIHSDSRHECGTCGKKFKTKRYLGIHDGVVHKGGSIEYKCPECSQVFPTYNARVKHLVAQHGKEDKIYKCVQCPKRYRLGSQLRAHVRSCHLQEKRHSCGHCGAAFFTGRLLRKHKECHNSTTTTSQNDKLNQINTVE